MAPRIIRLTLALILATLISCKKNKTEIKIEKSTDIEKIEAPSMKKTQTFNAEKTIKSHLAKTQYYRWYQLYERKMNTERIANQMDLFTTNISIESASGTMKGKENYPKRLDVYKGWKNAHHVQNVAFTKDNDGKELLIADIRYQNIKPDGKKTSYSLDYIMEFEDFSTKLPKLVKVQIKPTGTTEDSFKDSYPNNRVNSLMYYWLANMEQLDGNITPFKELLADNFELNFTSGQVNNIEDFEKWLNNAPKQLSQSSHHPKDLTIETVNETTFNVSVVFDWFGIAKNGQKMKAITKHNWVVVDDINERFARIKKMDVGLIEPFSVIK